MEKHAMPRDIKGILLVVLAAISWSTNSVLIKSVELDAVLIAGMRAAFAGLAYAAFIRPRKINWSWKLLANMAIYALQGTSIVVALKLTSAAIAIGMQFTAPVWIYLYSRLKGYPFNLRRALPLYVLALGIIVSMLSKADNVTLAGNLIALSSGVTFALLTVLSKQLGNENPIGIVSLNNLFTAAVILPFFCTDSLPSLLTLPVSSWLILAFLGVFQIGLGYVFYTLALRYTSSARASMVSPLEMVLSPLWVALAFHEWPDVIGMAGFLLIVVGIMMEAVFTLRYERAAALQSAHKQL